MTNAGVGRGKKGAVRTRLGLPVSLIVAVLPHADDRGRVAAALAALADARAAKQEHGNVGDPPAPRADGPQTGVTVKLGLRDRPGLPVGIDSWEQ